MRLPNIKLRQPTRREYQVIAAISLIDALIFIFFGRPWSAAGFLLMFVGFSVRAYRTMEIAPDPGDGGQRG
jgi:hypothetical protein